MPLIVHILSIRLKAYILQIGEIYLDFKNMINTAHNLEKKEPSSGPLDTGSIKLIKVLTIYHMFKIVAP